MDLRERDSALLTPRQREYLRGELDIKPRAERALRQRIRERLQATVFDVQLINQNLSLNDLDVAFESPEDIPQSAIDSQLPTFVTLLYLLRRIDETRAPHDGWHLEQIVESGIIRALRRNGTTGGAEVSIRVDRGEPLAELATGDLSELSADTLTDLLIAKEISKQEFTAAVDFDN